MCGCTLKNPKYETNSNCNHGNVFEKSTHIACGSADNPPYNKTYITVTGISPSTDFAGDWMTYGMTGCPLVGKAYSHDRYTALGLTNHIETTISPLPKTQHVISGRTNDLVFWTGVGLPNGDLTVSLAGADARLIIKNNKTGNWDVLLHPGNDSVNMDSMTWQDTYTSAKRPNSTNKDYYANAKLVCEDKGTATLSQSFSGTGTGPSGQSIIIGTSKSQEILSHDGYALRFNQNETYAENGVQLLYNPSGFPNGKTAKFKISLDPGSDISANDITWSVSNSNVSFQNGNTGFEVELLGIGIADTTLRVNSPKLHLVNEPVFHTTVMQEQEIDVVACVVLDDNGNTMQTVTLNDVITSINNANPIFRQKGIKLIPPTSLIYTNKSEWLVHENVTTSPHPTLIPMFASVQGAGKLKIFYVDYLYDGVGNIEEVNGLCMQNAGMAIRKERANKPDLHDLLTHETIHNYPSIRDIYKASTDNTLNISDNPNPTREKMPKDWIGAFYPFHPKNTTQEQIIDILIMRGSGYGGRVIPFGKIFGVYYDTQTGTFKLGLVPVGQEDSRGTMPKH